MTVPFLSVVVPVYNTEAYVRECLDSVRCAEETFEIILVNDGSTDGTRGILEDYARSRPELRIIDIRNSGPSVARNVGMAEARGHYVLFVDSDDFLVPGALDKMLRTLKRHALDCLLYAATVRYDVHDTHLKVRLDYERPASLCDQVMSGPAFFALALEAGRYVVQPCLYIFRRSCADRISFHPGIHHEDNLFTTELLLAGGVDRAMCSTERHYVRRVRHDSITTSGVALRDYWDLHAVLQGLLVMHEQGRVPAEAARGFGKFFRALVKFKLSVLISLFGPFFPRSLRWSSIRLLIAARRVSGSRSLMLCFFLPEIMVPVIASAKFLRKRVRRVSGGKEGGGTIA